MYKAISTGEHDQVFLQMELKKSSFKVDENGDFIFDVEASNENLDFEQQRVLQSALLDSKDYFLSNGVISKDHLHQSIGKDGKLSFNEEFVIGEPLRVYADGNSTRVRGRLYKLNKYAQEFIKLLQDKSTRVKASVGGMMPRVKKNRENGLDVGSVVSVLWNDLALTIAPVNPTVKPAYMVKSLNSLEFVKSLSAGYGTDSASFTGGRAMIRENLEGQVINRAQVSHEEAVESLIGALLDGDVKDLKEAIRYLSGFNIIDAVAQDLIEGIVEKKSEFREVLPMAKGALWDEIMGRLQKSMGKTIPEDDVDPDKLEQGTGDEDGEDEDKEESEDATPILKALSDQIEKQGEAIELIAKSLTHLVEQSENNVEMQKSISDGLIATMQRVDEFAKSPSPRRGAVTALEAAMAKAAKMPGSIPSSTQADGIIRHQQFSKTSRDEIMGLLTKAVSDGELSTIECGKIETQINKSIRDPNYQLDQNYTRFLMSKMGK